MEEKFIPYGKQTIEEDDLKALLQAAQSGWMTQGPKITEFENAVADRVGAKHAVAVATGTAALHAACLAAGIQKGDEVITAPITFAASGNCALYLGANVRFVDIKETTYCMDASRLEEAIREQTKVIIPVDFAGQPCDMDEINAIAKKYNLLVIHDAAHSIGATYKNRPVGSLADMTIFSFHPVKHIAMGEGGMVLTDNDKLAERLRLFRTHGITNGDKLMKLSSQAADNDNPYNKEPNLESRAPWYYEMQELGFNYRVTDMQCALGISQLKKLDRFLKRRRDIVAKYNRAFEACEFLITPYEEDDRRSAWHLYMLRLKLDHLKATRRAIFEQIRSQKIGVHVHYIPLHLQPYYQKKFGYKRGDFPVSENYYDTALTIPLYPGLTDEDCERVIQTILNVVQENALAGV